MSNKTYLIASLFLMIIVSGCGGGKEATTVESIETEKPKIITIGGTITEIVSALGEFESIVATDPTSTFPEEAKELPSLGYRNAIKAEGLISLGSDVIIAENGHLSEEVKQQLSSAGTNWYEVENQYTVEGTLNMIDEVARILNLEEKAGSLKQEIEDSITELELKVQARKEKPIVLIVYARGAGSLTIGGSDTFAETLFPLAGCTLAVPEIEGFKPLTTEALVKANPDYILFFDSGLASLGGVEGALEIPGVNQTIAGQKKQIISMDGLLMSGFGPRLHKALNTLFELTEATEQGN
ncbi:heme/hemin ABC transporter substrate-binding protein [Peijinzhouia sedimentorum]